MKCTDIRILENSACGDRINHECVLKDLLWWKSKIKVLVLVIHDLPVTSADVPLGQGFSNHFDHEHWKKRSFFGTQ